MYPFVFVGLLAIIGALLRDVFLGTPGERKNALSTMIIGLVLSLVLTPIFLWAGWCGHYEC